MLLDEVIFKQQGIPFGICDDGPDIGYLLHHDGDTRASHTLGKIATDALFQVFCLPDVKDIPVLINVLVDPRFMRQGLEQILNVYGCVCH